MKNEQNVKISSKISSLNPYLGENWIIKVEGRFEKSDVTNDCKHPILTPRDSHISKLIILWCRQKAGHSGRGTTLNEVIGSDFWIFNANSVTLFLIYHSETSISLREKLGEQLMSDYHLTDFKNIPHLHILVLTYLVLLPSKVIGKNWKGMA